MGFDRFAAKVSTIAKLLRETDLITVVTDDLSTAKLFVTGTEVFGGDMDAGYGLGEYVGVRPCCEDPQRTIL